ncbi:MAG TPA: SH3 domain-containing protein [Anaerolineae bacterium]|nr:SH3 domain-containing protein [Anaerolineae bacterium]
MRAKARVVRLVCLLAVLAAPAVFPTVAYAAPPSPPSDSESAPVVQAPPIPGAATTVTAGLGLRLREGPSTSDRVLLILRYGESVYPAAGPVWGGGRYWTYVFFYRWGYTYEGFCASQYLANYDPSTPGEDGTGQVRVTARLGLRLRGGPGTYYGIYRVVPYGTTLQTTGSTQWGSGLQWTQVSYGGYSLWAASMYLRDV